MVNRMPIHKKKLLLEKSLNRAQVRKKLIRIFLQEKPGTGKKEKTSRYFYYTEKLKDGNRIYLKRPAPLNKGVDFEVHVENYNFGKKRKSTMPSHSFLYNDLKRKKKEKPRLYKKIDKLIDKIFNCKSVSDKEMRLLKFKTGYPTELILKVIKWLFIEQDVTYWNWSGRFMLFKGIKEI